MKTASSASSLEASATGSGLTVRLTHQEAYPVYIGEDLETALGRVLADARSDRESGRVHVITDPVVAGHYLARVSSLAARAGLALTAHMLPEGEGAKSSQLLPALWRQLHGKGVDRRTLILALGGGAVCDAATLAAATYMRGLPCVLVPTTLIAQADAAIGGKGGADFAGVKNLVGAFYHPFAVIVDPVLLQTLDPRDFRRGMAEVIKVAVIRDRDLFAMAESRAAASPRGIEAVIRRAISGKLDLLAPDPFERHSLERPLNYGHCIGHAIEAATGFWVHHGEAVAIGMAVAAAIGMAGGYCPAGDLDRIARLLVSYHLPVTIPGPMRDAVWAGMDEVRRVRNGPLRLVVPDGIGKCAIIADVSKASFQGALEHLDRWREGTRTAEAGHEC